MKPTSIAKGDTAAQKPIRSAAVASTSPLKAVAGRRAADQSRIPNSGASPPRAPRATPSTAKGTSPPRKQPTASNAAPERDKLGDNAAAALDAAVQEEDASAIAVPAVEAVAVRMDAHQETRAAANARERERQARSLSCLYLAYSDSPSSLSPARPIAVVVPSFIHPHCPSLASHSFSDSARLNQSCLPAFW